MSQSPPPPNAGFDTPLDEPISSELGEWESPTATLASSQQYGLLEQEPTQPEQLERRAVPTEPFDQSTFDRPADSFNELQSFEPPAPQTHGIDGQPESEFLAPQPTMQPTMQAAPPVGSPGASQSTPAMPPFTPKMPPPSPTTPKEPTPDSPAPTPPEQPASTAPVAAELASWAAPTSSMPPAPTPTAPSTSQPTPSGTPANSRTWATPKASTEPQLTTNDSWDPLEGWDPSAPLDASSPIGSGSPSQNHKTPPPNGGAQPNQQSLPPIGEPNPQPLAGSTSSKSVEFGITNTDGFPSNNQMIGESSRAQDPMTSSVGPEYGSPIDNGINTGRVVTMALLGGFALVVFFVRLASLF